jgi:hypothetical protein
LSFSLSPQWRLSKIKKLLSSFSCIFPLGSFPPKPKLSLCRWVYLSSKPWLADRSP